MLAVLLMAAARPVISLSVNETMAVRFDPSWEAAKEAGIRATTLSLDWNQLEFPSGSFNMDVPLIAASFYPFEEASLGVVLRAIDTDRDVRPTRVRSKSFSASFDDWKKFADEAMGALSTVKLNFIAIGNEADVFLKTEDQIRDYAAFAQRARAHLHSLRPGVPVGTTLTEEGLRTRPDALKPILDASDAVFANWYHRSGVKDPASVAVPRTLDHLTRVARKKPLFLTEAGAPSGTVAGSSESAQAQFVTTLLAEAKTRRLPYVNFVWMNDELTAKIDGYVARYGLKDPAFRDYLATLGLRREDGSPKPAWEALRAAMQTP